MSRRDHSLDVTIGFCVRNSERTVKASLDSILNQDYPKSNMKIIIVDGNSADRTIEIARKMLRRSRIESEFHSDGGKGLGAARQLVLDHSSGKYIVWVDGDVVVSSDFVTNQVKYMEGNPGVGVATGKCVLHESVNSTLPGFLQDLNKHMGSARYTQTKDYRGLPTNDASIYRIDASKGVGGFDKAIRGAGEDEDLIFRIRRAGWSISVNIDARFYAFTRETWRSLWVEYVWIGRGKHFIYHKHKELHIPMITPPVSFIIGLRGGHQAYKLTLERKSFLLPLWHVFITIAKWFGFIGAHHSGYGH